MTNQSLETLSPFQYQAGLENATNIAEATGSAAASSGTYGLMGNLLGAGINAYGAYKGAGLIAAAMASSPKFKKNIKKTTDKDEDKAMDMVKDLDTNTFRYKGESGSTHKRMGLLTTTAPKEIVKGDYLDVGRTLGLLTVATKTLAKKVDKLEGRAK